MPRFRRTEKQVEEVKAALLAFVREYSAEHGQTPTRDLIGERLGIKTRSLVSYYLAQLEADGLIERHGTSLPIILIGGEQ